MKRLLSFFASILILGIIFNTNAQNKYELNEQEKESVNRIYQIYTKKIDKNGGKYKDKLTNDLRIIVNKLEIGSKNYEILMSLTSKLENYGINDDKKIKEELTEEKNQIEKQDNQNKIEENQSNQNISENNNIDNIYRVNLGKVRETWVQRQNEVRIPMGLSNYNTSLKLENTANEWSKIMAGKNQADHKREAGDSYYNYNKIALWLKDRGVVCKNKDRYTFSESVAWTSYVCSENAKDCTYELIDGLRLSFDRYMSEKDKNENSRPHYNAIVSPNFKTQGMGIAINKLSPTKYEVFITTHYCTELAE